MTKFIRQHMRYGWEAVRVCSLDLRDGMSALVTDRVRVQVIERLGLRHHSILCDFVGSPMDHIWTQLLERSYAEVGR